MEIIIGLVVLGVIAYLVFRPKKVEEAVVEVAPYKVESTEVANQASDAMVESVAKPAKKPRAKKPAAKATATKKPAAKATGVKKPRTKKPTTK